MLDYADFIALAALYTSKTVRLSPDSLTLLLCTYPDVSVLGHWRGATTEQVTIAQWDEIEALIGKCYGELMTEVTKMPLGAIFPFMTTAVPEGALECDGTEYLRTDYPDLYAVLDAAFITDADHFTTPDMRGRVPLGVGQGTGLSDYSPGETGGTEGHVLSVDELAYHNHVHVDSGHAHNYYRPNMDGASLGSGTTAVRTRTFTTTSQENSQINPGFTGANYAHENRQPFLAMRYAVWSSI